MNHLLIEAARYRGSGGGYALTLFFRWLWHQIGWWSMFVYVPFGLLALYGLWNGDDN